MFFCFVFDFWFFKRKTAYEMRISDWQTCALPIWPKRLRDRSDACRLDILGAGAVDLAERDHHPAAIAGDFERLDAVLRHREEQCEFGRNRLAVLAEFGATAADRLDIADVRPGLARRGGQILAALDRLDDRARSEEHTSELQSLMRISYAVFFWKKKNNMT